MWGENVDSHNTPYNDQLYAYQLVQKDNELNTGNWIELCFSIQPKIGVHVCPVDTISQAAALLVRLGYQKEEPEPTCANAIAQQQRVPVLHVKMKNRS
jgi:hypothetical protein